MRNVIIFKRAKFSINDNGIIVCEFFNNKEGYKMDLKTAKKYAEAISSLANGKLTSFIVDLRHARGTYTLEAAKYIASCPELKSVRLSEAFVYNSMSSKLLILSYKRIYDPLTPYTITKNIDNAVEYCNKLQNAL